MIGRYLFCVSCGKFTSVSCSRVQKSVNMMSVWLSLVAIFFLRLSGSASVLLFFFLRKSALLSVVDCARLCVGCMFFSALLDLCLVCIYLRIFFLSLQLCKYMMRPFVERVYASD